MLSVVMLSVTLFCHAEYRYAERRVFYCHAEWHPDKVDEQQTHQLTTRAINLRPLAWSKLAIRSSAECGILRNLHCSEKNVKWQT
jgi:hypothetical protein